MTKRVKIATLERELVKLRNGNTEFRFFGITSNGIDCIYFIYENEKFKIEFEAMTEEQLNFIEKLSQFALSQNIPVKNLSYDNQPQYSSDKPAPVLSMETGSSLVNTMQYGIKIQTEIFGNDSNTIYDIVP